MAKNNKWVQIMAFLALFWIIIWIIWTWMLILFWGNNTTEQTLSPEQYLELQEYINAQSGTIVETSTWVQIETNNWSETLTWEIK